MNGFTYLDHLTATPVRSEAARITSRLLEEGFGHPRSTNLPGRRAQRMVEQAESTIARFFGGSRTIFYYDGGVANGLSVLSMGRLAREKGRNGIICSPAEHSSIFSALRILNSEGSSVILLDMDSNGRIDPDSLNEHLTDEVGLVTVSWASGISGILQPVEELSRLTRSRGVLFHSDARNAAGRVGIDLRESDIDVITVSSGLMGGPPGTAACIIAGSDPWMMSAAPEFSCMTNIPGICGMEAAVELIGSSILPRTRIVNKLRSDLISGLEQRAMDFRLIGGTFENVLPGVALLCVFGAPEKFHLKLEKEGIILPSHNSSERLSYLERVGEDTSDPDSYLGFSLCTSNSIVDIEHLLRAMTSIFSESRG